MNLHQRGGNDWHSGWLEARDVACRLMTPDYIAPHASLDAFNCPWPDCQAFANQRWFAALASAKGQPVGVATDPPIGFSKCDRCRRHAIWVDTVLIFPAVMTAPLAHPDLAEPALSSYNEARAVLSGSPRASAALLRLCLQELVGQLGAESNDLNTAIGDLVASGLSPTIQRAMDALRVIGNDNVHPGVLSVKDDPATAVALFELVNLTVQTMVTDPARAKELFDRIPDSQKDQIAKRDTRGGT